MRCAGATTLRSFDVVPTGARTARRAARLRGRYPFLTPRLTDRFLSPSASEPLSVSAERGERPLRRACRFRQHRVAETALGARRTRAGANSGIPAVEHARLSRAIGCAPRRHATTRWWLRRRPSMASLEASANNLLRGFLRARCAPTGPLEHGEWTPETSAGWRTGCAPVRRRHRDVPLANPGGRERIRSPGMDEGRVRGVAFLFVPSLWPCKEKAPAHLGGARNKTRMSMGSRIQMDPGLRRDDRRGSA